MTAPKILTATITRKPKSKVMPELEKSTTVEYFGCKACEQKLAVIPLTQGSAFDNLFSLGSSSKAMYCDNKECEEYGYLTVVGIKKRQ